jgi:hypothetical protein
MSQPGIGKRARHSELHRRSRLVLGLGVAAAIAAVGLVGVGPGRAIEPAVFRWCQDLQTGPGAKIGSRAGTIDERTMSRPRHTGRPDCRSAAVVCVIGRAAVGGQRCRSAAARLVGECRGAGHVRRARLCRLRSDPLQQCRSARQPDRHDAQSYWLRGDQSGHPIFGCRAPGADFHHFLVLGAGHQFRRELHLLSPAAGPPRRRRPSQPLRKHLPPLFCWHRHGDAQPGVPTRRRPRTPRPRTRFARQDVASAPFTSGLKMRRIPCVGERRA